MNHISKMHRKSTTSRIARLFALALLPLCGACICFCICACSGAGGGASGAGAGGRLQTGAAQSVRVELPDASAYPAARLLWQSGASLQWRLEWFDSQQRLQSKELPLEAADATCDFSMNNATPVLAHLLVNGKKFFYPFGAIYPQNLGEGATLPLDYTNGVSADVLFRILAAHSADFADAQHFCNYFNWQKLQEAVAKKPNPQLVDRGKVAAEICAADFSASDIKEQKTFTAKLDAPHSYKWLVSRDLAKEPAYNGNSFQVPLPNADFFSDRGFVLVEKDSAKQNAIVITAFER